MANKNGLVKLLITEEDVDLLVEAVGHQLEATCDNNPEEVELIEKLDSLYTLLKSVPRG